VIDLIPLLYDTDSKEQPLPIVQRYRS